MPEAFFKKGLDQRDRRCYHARKSRWQGAGIRVRPEDKQVTDSRFTREYVFGFIYYTFMDKACVRIAQEGCRLKR